MTWQTVGTIWAVVILLLTYGLVMSTVVSCIPEIPFPI